MSRPLLFTAWVLLALGTGLRSGSSAYAQDFSAPRLVDEDGVDPPKRRRPGTPEPAEDDNGARDDGSNTEILPGRQPRRVDNGALPDRETRGPAAPLPADAAAPARPAPSTPPGTGPNSAPTPAPTPANAAPPPVPPPSPTATPSRAPEGPRLRDTVKVETHTYEELARAWELRRLEAVRDPAAGQRALLGVLSMFRAMGGGEGGGAEAPDMALALAQESNTLRDKLEVDRALALAQAATTLAPSQPAPHLAVFAARRMKNTGEGPGPWSVLADALWADLSQPFGQIHWAFCALLALLLTPLVLWVGGLLMFMLRRFVLLAHDVGHVFPQHMRGVSGLGLAALVLALPLMTGVGVLVAGLWWCIWVWRYLDRWEQRPLVVLACITAVVPLFLPWVTPLAGAASTPMGEAALSLMDLARAAQEKKILAVELKDPVLLAVRGTLHKRHGALPQARADLEAAVRQDPKPAWFHNNLGCVYAAMGDPARAAAEFERAAELDPSEPLHLFNQGTMQNALGQLGSARATFEALDALSRPAASILRDRVGGQQPLPHNQVALDMGLPALLVWSAALDQTDRSMAMADDLWHLVSPMVPRAAYPFMVGGALAALFLLRVLLARRLPAVACRKCGAPACTTCDGKETDGSHCGPCFNVFVLRGAKVDAALKIRKDVQIRRYRTRQAWLVRGLSLLWGGSGLWSGGHPVAGLVLAGVFGVLVGLGALVGFAIPDPLRLGSAMHVWRMALLLLPAALVWVVGVVWSVRLET